MSYFRRGIGDVITDPCQIDPSICTTIAGTTGPTRVDCAQLPADSPFRAAGQPCGPNGAPPASPNGGGPFDWLLGVIRSDVAAATPPADMTDGTKLLLGGAAVIAAYYLLFRKKR